MPPETAKLLFDMAGAANLIRKFTAGKSFADYLSDVLLRSGVERQYTILGEAMTRLIKRDPAVAARITDFRQIKGFRNALVHGYDTIDHETSWRIVGEEPPILIAELDVLLAEPIDGFPQP